MIRDTALHLSVYRKARLATWLPEGIFEGRDQLVRMLHGSIGLPFPLVANHPVKPFFLMGSGRSGNTLLRRMLIASPEVYIPEETYFMRALIKKARQATRSDWSSYSDRLLGVIAQESDPAPTPDMLKRCSDRLKVLPNEQRTLAGLVDCYFRVHAETAGKPDARWGDKTPMYAHSARAIIHMYPDARIIHMLRDGVDAAVSFVEAGLCKSIEEGAWRWRAAVRRMRSLNLLFAGQVLTVRYEDLVTNPELSLSNVCRFLDVAYKDVMIQSEQLAHDMVDTVSYHHHSRVFNPLTSSRIGHGRRQLNAQSSQKLACLLDTDLVELGYSRVIEHG